MEKRTAKWLALSDLWCAQHGVIWNNVRFYFNGVTGRFEPIGWDGNAGEGRQTSIAWMAHDGGPWHFGQIDANDMIFDMLRDPVFSRAYAKALYKFSQRDYLLPMIKLVTEILEPVHNAFQSIPEYPGT